MISRAEKEEWTYEALLQVLFAEEVAHRRGTRLARAVRGASFPFLRTVEEFDFTYQSTLRLTTIGSLLSVDFVTGGHAVILEGKPGRGKTHLAIAIAYRAMQNGFEALFVTAAALDGLHDQQAPEALGRRAPRRRPRGRDRRPNPRAWQAAAARRAVGADPPPGGRPELGGRLRTGRREPQNFRKTARRISGTHSGLEEHRSAVPGAHAAFRDCWCSLLARTSAPA